MLYTFLITIVFIAEIIIAVTLLRALWKLDKAFVLIDETVTEARPKIKDISELSTKISEQIIELAEDFREKVKKQEEETTLKVLNKILVWILLWKVNVKAIRKFRKTKLAKILGKGLNLLQSMV